LRVLKNVEKLH
jgi:hypothetical protein